MAEPTNPQNPTPTPTPTPTPAPTPSPAPAPMPAPTPAPTPAPAAKTNEPTPAPTAAPKAPTSLLDDDPKPADPNAAPAATDPNAAPAPSAEEVQKWTEGVKTLDLGDGVTWDDEALGAMTPELMKLSGNDPKKAEGIVKAYTAYRQNEINRVEEANQAYATALVAECQKRFGDDLKTITAQAKIGGLHVFGETIWNQLRTVPQFCNNPDIIERFAAIGRTVKPDTGAVQPKDGKTQPASRDWREGMYGKGK